MEIFEPKKLALLRIYQVLRKYSDINHPLKQEDISNILKKEYDLEVERKAIGRNVSLLKEVGVDVIQTRSGSYIDSREFDKEDTDILIDSITLNPHLGEEKKLELINKVIGLQNDFFKSSLSDIRVTSKINPEFNFRNLNCIDEAIKTNKKVSYSYNKYDLNLKLVEVVKEEVSPIEIVLDEDNMYHLISFSEELDEIISRKISIITNVNVLDTDRIKIEDYEIDERKETVIFLTDEDEIDKIVSNFGMDIKLEKVGKDIEVTIKTSLKKAERYILENTKNVEVIYPENLRKKIRKTLKKSLEKYK